MTWCKILVFHENMCDILVLFLGDLLLSSIISLNGNHPQELSYDKEKLCTCAYEHKNHNLHQSVMIHMMKTNPYTH